MWNEQNSVVLKWMVAGFCLLLPLISTASAQASPGTDPNSVDTATQERIEGLIEQLGDEDRDITQSATETLHRIGQPAVQSLTNALQDVDPLIRRRALMILVGWAKNRNTHYPLPIKQMIELLIDSLEDGDDDVRNAAAENLGLIGITWPHRDDVRIYLSEAVQPLAKLLEHPSSQSYFEATTALGRIGHPSAIHPLIEAMKTHDYHDSQLAAFALEEIGPKAARPLLGALRTMDYKRGCAEYALWKVDKLSYIKWRYRQHWAVNTALLAVILVYIYKLHQNAAKKSNERVKAQEALSQEKVKWTCGKCGEQVEDQFDSCWKCGKSRED